jgi:hypothetical protein
VVKPAGALYRLSVAQFHTMIEAGIFHSGDKVELLEGYLIQKMTHPPPHAMTLLRILAELQTRLPQGWLLRPQMPITTPDSEPQPDCVVAPGPTQRFARSHPRPADIPLVIEVADGNLPQDRNEKLRIDARGRIPIYWIVNIPEMHIEVYTEPRGGRNPTYRQRRDYLPVELIPLMIAGHSAGTIAVRDLLP